MPFEYEYKARQNTMKMLERILILNMLCQIQIAEMEQGYTRAIFFPLPSRDDSELGSADCASQTVPRP